MTDEFALGVGQGKFWYNGLCVIQALRYERKQMYILFACLPICFVCICPPNEHENESLERQVAIWQ